MNAKSHRMRTVVIELVVLTIGLGIGVAGTEFQAGAPGASPKAT